ncbi:MAG: antitoxin [Acidimicrobiales bacterium]|nr:antitoxin [Acidimicrobiales bacterium]
MRTTVNLDNDLVDKIHELASSQRTSFKKVLNETIRSGLSGKSVAHRDFQVKAKPMGIRPSVNLDKALFLAGELEDIELLRKIELRK